MPPPALIDAPVASPSCLPILNRPAAAAKLELCRARPYTPQLEENPLPRSPS